MVEKIFLILLIIPVLYLFILLIGKTINTIAESNHMETVEVGKDGFKSEKSSKQKRKTKEKKAVSPKRRKRKKTEENVPIQEESLNFYEQKSKKSIYAEKHANRGNTSKK